MAITACGYAEGETFSVRPEIQQLQASITTRQLPGSRFLTPYATSLPTAL